MHISEGFLLGLSTGVVCMAYCGPVMVPYLMGEGNTVGRNAKLVAIFLAGRLLAYIAVGFLAGLVGKTIIQPSETRTHLMGLIYIVLSGMLIAYGFFRFREICLGSVQSSITRKFRPRFILLVPFVGGLVTGLNLCPPFLLAITKAVDTGQVSRSVMFFILFFLGTSLYFIPFPFIGFFRRQHVLRIIGKFAAILTGLLYFYQGLILLL